MAGFLIRRTLRGVITLWLVVTAVFVVLRLSGDPAEAMLGPDATPAALEAFRIRNGLNDAIPVQYVRYLARACYGRWAARVINRWTIRQATTSVHGSMLHGSELLP
ncbi:MAG: hypothetical protein ACR2LS_10390 [Thermomicrobiales bacterium]